MVTDNIEKPSMAKSRHRGWLAQNERAPVKQQLGLQVNFQNGLN